MAGNDKKGTGGKSVKSGKSEKNEVMIILAKLVIISLLAAVLLAATYIPTQKQLKINYKEAREQALKDLLPAASTFDPVFGDAIIDEDGNKEVLYYRALDSTGNLVGFAFFKKQTGSQSIIEVAGGFTPDNVLTGIQIMSHAETPGLGAKIVTPEFKDQFKGVAKEDLRLSKKGGKIDSITGASISSQAVIDALTSKIDEIQKAEK